MFCLSDKICHICGGEQGSGQFCSGCGAAQKSSSSHERLVAAQVLGPPVGAMDAAVPPGGQPKRRLGRRTLLVGAFIAALVVAFGAVVVVRAVRPPEHTFQGIVQLSDTDGLSQYNEGDTCSGSGGYDDIATQAQVTVFDASSTIIGTGRLSSGKMQNGYCRFPFTVAKVKESDAYQIEVGREGRGKLRYSQSDAQKVAYTFELSLGNGIPVPNRPSCPSESDLVATATLSTMEKSFTPETSVAVFSLDVTNRSSANVTFDVDIVATFANGKTESGNFQHNFNVGESGHLPSPMLEVPTSWDKPTSVSVSIANVRTSDLCK